MASSFTNSRSADAAAEARLPIDPSTDIPDGYRADQRGRRIGRRLLAAVVEWARQRRAVQVEAVVGEGDAKRFYQSFGFAVANDRLVLAA
jgi:GNAT superfamily N-acetyltransferase